MSLVIQLVRIELNSTQVYLLIFPYFVENQNSDKPRENEKVVKRTKEFALFQLHRYSSFNFACPTDVLRLRFSDE